MITKLTKEQEEQIPHFIDKWVNQISVPMNHDRAFSAIDQTYSRMKEEKPIKIVGTSPLNTAMLASLFWLMFDGDKKQLDSQLHLQLGSQLRSQLDLQLRSQLRSQLDSQLHLQLDSQLDSQLGSQLDLQLGSQLRSQLRSQLDSQLHLQLGSQLHLQLGSQLRSQLDSQLRSQLDSQLDSQLGSQLDSQLGSQLRSQLRSQLDSQLHSQLGSQLRSQLHSQLHLQLGSQLDSQLGKINNDWYMNLWWLVWCGWYDYGKFIGAKLDKDLFDLFLLFNSEIHFIIPYKGICFISEKPTEIHWNNKELHKDGDMAVKYPDGYGMYCLNGIKVPEYLAITPESELTLDFFQKEQNADVKAEFIRKYGIDRMMSLGKKIDSWENYSDEWWAKSEYELIDMSPIFESIDYAPHILMKNQTVKGLFHLEAVAPECKNLEQAMNWRESIRNEKYITLDIK